MKKSFLLSSRFLSQSPCSTPVSVDFCPCFKCEPGSQKLNVANLILGLILIFCSDIESRHLWTRPMSRSSRSEYFVWKNQTLINYWSWSEVGIRKGGGWVGRSWFTHNCSRWVRWAGRLCQLPMEKNQYIATVSSIVVTETNGMAKADAIYVLCWLWSWFWC